MLWGMQRCQIAGLTGHLQQARRNLTPRVAGSVGLGAELRKQEGCVAVGCIPESCMKAVSLLEVSASRHLCSAAALQPDIDCLPAGEHLWTHRCCRSRSPLTS